MIGWFVRKRTQVFYQEHTALSLSQEVFVKLPLVTNNLRILVVDDYAMMRRIICGLLREMGVGTVEEAEDGVVALSKLRLNAPFHLVITDVNMPNLNGFELLKAIKADESLRHLPVLMVTAEARKEDIALAAQSGAAGYIIKPFTRDVLEKKVQKILEKSAPAYLTGKAEPWD